MSYQECISGFNWFPDIENSLKIKWISRELFTAIMQTFSLPEKSNGISRYNSRESHNIRYRFWPDSLIGLLKPFIQTFVWGALYD